VTIPVYTHPACLLHDPGPDHPETPARLRVLLERLRAEPGVAVRDAAPATVDELAVVHPREYLASIEALAEKGGGPIFLDTVLNRWSWDAALGAAGAALAAMRHAHEQDAHAFAAIRPPGHHALGSRAMGFCLVNSVVVAARHARSAGRQRVLIVDWDVHHGNGTQALVEQDPSIRFVSLHQHPWYPGTGLASERGVGNVFNVPRPPDLPSERYVGDLWAAIVEATTGWTPDLVLVSAGFDAMLDDPLGGFTLEPPHYADLTHRLRERLPATPIVGLSEGGYIPERLAEGTVAHLAALA
jgi:acetoin utilization deacetylase AcuC-like enzyme